MAAQASPPVRLEIGFPSIESKYTPAGSPGRGDALENGAFGVD